MSPFKSFLSHIKFAVKSLSLKLKVFALSAILKLRKSNAKSATALSNFPLSTSFKPASPDFKLTERLTSLGAKALNKTGSEILSVSIFILTTDFSSIFPPAITFAPAKFNEVSFISRILLSRTTRALKSSITLPMPRIVKAPF